MHRVLIAYKSFISAPPPLCCNLWAHWIGLWQLLLLPIEAKYHILFSHCFLRTDTTKSQQLHHFFTYVCNTLCLPKISPYFPTILHYYNTVPNYRRWLIRNCRSDQIEQQLTSIKRISTILPVLVLVLVACAWTTINLITYKTPSYLFSSHR